VRRLSELGVALLAGILMLAVLLTVGQSAPVRRIEAQLLDLRFQLRDAPPPGDEVVLVLIDDASIEAIGRWPWPRRHLARLVERLDALGARVIGLDLLFTEPEHAPALDAAVVDLHGVIAAPPGGPGLGRALARLESLLEGDRALAAAIGRAGNVVLPYYFTFPPDGVPLPPLPPPEPIAAAAWGPAEGPLPLAAEGVIAPLPALGREAAAFGHVTVALDASGSARFEYPLIRLGERALPSFALELARLAAGLARDEVAIEWGRGIRLGRRFAPTDEAMRLLVDYGGGEPLPRLSARELLEGEVDRSLIEDRVVVVGAAATGIADSVVTPFTSVLPGVERQALITTNLLDDRHLLRRDVHTLADIGLIVLAAFAIGLAGRLFGFAGAGSVTAVLLALVIGLNLYAFLATGVWLELFLPAGSVVVIGAATMLRSQQAAQAERRRIEAAFGHYLHPALVDRLCREPDLLAPGGETRELTVLFADIRGFTGLAERLPADGVVTLLNRHFEAMTEAVLAEGGMLDKYQGDGLMAVFGAPVPQDDHALRACRAALTMSRAFDEQRRAREADGLPGLDLGIGINTGGMVIGNIGARGRLDYTVIGDAVNVAARLEAATREAGARILVSEATREAAGPEIAAEEVAAITLRGRAAAVRAFRLPT
jgi:adenylate cyclase